MAHRERCLRKQQCVGILLQIFGWRVPHPSACRVREGTVHVPGRRSHGVNIVGLHSRARNAFGRDETENERNEPSSGARKEFRISALPIT